MNLVVRDAQKDPSHLVPALPPSTKPTIEPTFGRPKPLTHRSGHSGSGPRARAPAPAGPARARLRATGSAHRPRLPLAEGMATDPHRGLWLSRLTGLLVAVLATPALAHPGGGDEDVPAAASDLQGRTTSRSTSTSARRSRSTPRS